MEAKLIPQNTDDLKQRRLLNVVAEMAIASGTPAPPVYLLEDELAINAFAAGFSPRDAVIGVTRGAINWLNRDQLQGVIAHEFSHIFNGDMRLNIRLIGLLNGILVIGHIGYWTLRAAPHSRRRGALAAVVFGLGLMIIGYAGTVFGSLIKSAVSRQREYLADASAVQFTRNPDGIAGALKRIGGLRAGSILDSPGAPEISHALFARGVSGFIQSVSAIHPPLAERIRRIDPQWNGEYLTSDIESTSRDGDPAGGKSFGAREALASHATLAFAGAAKTDVADAISQIGNPKQETIDYARSLIVWLPASIKEAAAEPFGARAVIYLLLLDVRHDVRDLQLRQLESLADSNVYALTRKLMPEVTALDIKYRLPLIDLAMPALKQLSLSQYRLFRENVVTLIDVDARIDLLEWSLQKILLNHLDGQFFKLARKKAPVVGLNQVKSEIELLLSLMAHAGQLNGKNVEAAFEAAAKTLKLSGLQMRRQKDFRLGDLDRAVQKLAGLKPRSKPLLLSACAACVLHDRVSTVVEIELFRAVSGALDCPIPLVIL
ncbi:MAG: M48 family metallopeptidase [Proteobacteria bacterium]|nr:M48 family metallopeptidase [Pseudomonadota bacterium]